MKRWDEPGHWTRRVRTTDPVTSREAAQSVQNTLRESQSELLRLLRESGALTDEEIELRAANAGIRQSVSGLRTRRSELVRLNLVRDSGKTKMLASGRRAIVWEVVPDSEQTNDDDVEQGDLF